MVKKEINDLRILVIDNYDSFTYNLVQYIQELGVVHLEVYRNDAISLEAIESFDAIVLSPGPGLPKDAGAMPQIIERFHQTKPILGVCLGHQGIAEFFGAKLYNLKRVYHGIATTIKITPSPRSLFLNLPTSLLVGRYHSWMIEGLDSDAFQVTATTPEGEVMAFEHKEHPLWGVQFHPESILTPEGKVIMQNFLFQVITYLEKTATHESLA